MSDLLQQPALKQAVDDVPEVLRGRVEDWLEQFAGRLANAQAELSPPSEHVLASLPRVWASSEFVVQALLRQPELFTELVGSGDLEREAAPAAIDRAVSDAVEVVTDEAGLMATLRRLRQREIVRAAWRDLAGWATLQETTGHLSALAEACIDAALCRLYDWQCEELGTPVSQGGTTQRMVVLGMGKLGAWELNFSSDVDLIFAFPESGETRDGPRPLSNDEFFARLGRRLIAALDQKTADGFVFRVDMRLRPFGDSGPLVSNFDALEDYYQRHGREWERYAMVKARVVGGDRQAGERLMALLKPFVYRRYLDFGAFESLRDMKALIAREVQRKGMEHNVKLGAGGIREVEFTAQAFQLIRGGREPALQERRVVVVLERLATAGYLPHYVVDELTQAYVFLRRVEHRLQEYADQQTHALPKDEAARLRLAFSMGFDDWPALDAALRKHRLRVHSHFDQVFESPQSGRVENQEQNLDALWRAMLDEARAVAVLERHGFVDPTEAWRRLNVLRDSRKVQAMSAGGRERLDRLMPLLLGAVAGAGAPDLTLARVLDLIDTVVRRTAYLALLFENPMALSQLVRLCHSSPWISNLLTRYPVLLDELLDARTLYVPLTKSQLEAELRERLAELPADDLEAQMEALRHFKQTNMLRIAAADVTGAVPLMQVSDQLTWIAEAVVEEVLELAWNHLVAKHGRPLCSPDGEVCDKGFVVIGYGKLGGIELGYGSDLDLVFVHAAESDELDTDGEQPVAVPTFFARLGQRMIHILTAQTPSGVLYEVDMRLRPSGASGLLVSSLGAFDRYQREQAWTWEHQALVRARVVAGDAQVRERFDRIRGDVLSRERDPTVLRREVREMRERMREANTKAHSPDEFDIKQDRGGIADIEFMVQYGALAWAHAHPQLLTYTDNIRILDGFAAEGLLSPADCALLADAYRAYRAVGHRQALQQQPTVVPAAEFAAYRERVIALWEQLMAD